MTSAELRRIVGAMTERPWNYGQDNDPYDGEIEDSDKIVANVRRIPVAGNTIGIVTLANHADALVALVEAVERLAAASDVSEFAVYKYKLFSALDDIHAIKEQP